MIIIIIIICYAKAAKPCNTIKHRKNTVKSTEMYKNVIRPSHSVQLITSHGLYRLIAFTEYINSTPSPNFPCFCAPVY